MFEWFRRLFTRHNTQGENQSPDVPMTKHYVFNETGNIMLCATTDSINDFNDAIKDSFIDVSVFFTAMTKAVHSTTNPVTGKPFSIYNYQAVKHILSQSGMFVEMNVEEGVFSSTGVGAPMGKDLIQALLNRKFSESRLGFSQAMFNGMAFQEPDAEKRSGLNKEERKLCRNGNIFFICELLLGLPQTTAVLVNIRPSSIDGKTREKETDAQDLFSLGKLDDQAHQHKGNRRYWTFKKRTYLFLPPKFIKNNIAALRDADSIEYEDLITSIADRLKAATQSRVPVENE